MANEINILTGGDISYTAVYVNGSRVSHTRGCGNEDIILENVCRALDESVDKTGTVVNSHDVNDFEWEKIWINGEGFVPDWSTVEAARL
jgi:hypothetical protein